MRHVLSLIMCLLWASPSLADWSFKTLALGGGGFVTGIAIHTDGTMFVRTDTYGGYVWNSGTSKWDQVVNSNSMPVDDWDIGWGEGVYEVAIDPSTSTTLWMVFRGYPYKSTDSGVTWVRKDGTGWPGRLTTLDPNDWTNGASTAGQKMAIDPNDGDVVYIGTVGNDLLYTTDGGANWAAAPTVTDGTATPGVTGICFISSSVIYAASYNNGVYKTVNSGANWTKISDGVGDPDIVNNAECADGSYYAASNDDDTLWEYDGAAWTDLAPGGDGNLIYGVAVDPNDATRIIAIQDNGAILVSENSGVGWDALASSARTAPNISWHDWTTETFFSTAEIEFNANTGDLYVAQGIGVWKTTVGAIPLGGSITWTETSVGIENLVVNDITAAPNESNVHVCVADRGSFSLADDDTYADEHGPVQTMTHCWGIDYDATDTSNPKLAQANHRYAGGQVDYSAHSVNGGTAWTQFGGAYSVVTGGSIAVSDPNSMIAYDCGRNGAYWTSDGGANWTLIDDFSSDVCWGASGSWSPLKRHIVAADTITVDKFYLYFVDPDAHADDGIWVTTDGGDTWSEDQPTLLNSTVIDAYNGTLRAAPGQGGHVWWTPGDASGADPNLSAKMWKSEDSADTWAEVTNVMEVKSFGFGSTFGTYPRIYIAGWVDTGGWEWGIWYSDDKAANWTKIGDGVPLGIFDAITVVEGAKDGTERVYLGFLGGGAVYGEPAAVGTGTPRAGAVIF